VPRHRRFLLHPCRATGARPGQEVNHCSATLKLRRCSWRLHELKAIPFIALEASTRSTPQTCSDCCSSARCARRSRRRGRPCTAGLQPDRVCTGNSILGLSERECAMHVIPHACAIHVIPHAAVCPLPRGLILSALGPVGHRARIQCQYRVTRRTDSAAFADGKSCTRRDALCCLLTLAGRTCSDAYSEQMYGPAPVAAGGNVLAMSAPANCSCCHFTSP
jgi:hypothetical protein